MDSPQALETPKEGRSGETLLAVKQKVCLKQEWWLPQSSRNKSKQIQDPACVRLRTSKTPFVRDPARFSCHEVIWLGLTPSKLLAEAGLKKDPGSPSQENVQFLCSACLWRAIVRQISKLSKFKAAKERSQNLIPCHKMRRLEAFTFQTLASQISV